MLYKNDLIFLLKKTGLDLKKFTNLIEEERDFDLVIESIACNLKENDYSELNKLSNHLRVKLSLYNLACSKNYDISEKSYMASILAENYDYVYKNSKMIKNGQKTAIKNFISVINEKNINNNKINMISNNFTKMGQIDVSKHISEWVHIIKQSKENLVKIS